MTAQANVLPVAGETVVIEIETAPGAGTYGAPMSINLARNLEMTSTAEATVIPRIDNPSAPGYTDRTNTAFDWKATGAGVANIGDDYTYAQWWLAGGKKNIQISNANTGGLVLTGPAVMTSLTPFNSGGLGKKADFSITLECAGLPTIAAHA